MNNTDVEYVRSTQLSIETADSPAGLQDDFESTLLKFKTTSGTGAFVVALDNTVACNGAQSLKLTTRPAGVNGDTVTAGRVFGNPNTGQNFNVRFNYMVPNPVAEFWDLEIHLIVYDHLLKQDFGFRSDNLGAGVWQLLRSGGTWSNTNIPIADYGVAGVEDWHNVAFAGNLDRKLWTFARVNNQAEDLTAFNLAPDNGASGLYHTEISFTLTCRNASGNASQVNIDDLDITFRG